MKIKLSLESYKGGDGSSLSSTRCSQIVQVYEMLESIGDRIITYIDIQEEAQNRRLFGATQAKSAIRTFFPLLRKIGFVCYDGSFPANSCFTELGVQFVLACRAMENVTDDTPHKEEIIERLCSIKRNAQQKGLVNMYHNPECKSHNIWTALRLLKKLKVIHWNEFLYALHCIIDQGKTIDDTIEEILQNKKKIDNIEFLNEDGDPLPSTSFTYIRGYLEEAGIISKVSSSESKLQEDAKLFYSQIDL